MKGPNSTAGGSAIHVAFINNFGGPTMGGGEVQLLALLDGLAKTGIQATLACAADSALQSQASRIEGVGVVPVVFEGAVSVRGLARTIARSISRPDIVQGTGFLTNVVARSVGSMLDARVVNAVHVMPGASRLDGEGWAKGLVRGALDRASRGNVDRYVAVSSAVAAKLVEDGASRDAVTVIRNGLDLGRMREDAARAMALDSGHPRVGYLGRLESVKGCEYFIEAVMESAQRHPEVEFLVAGEGSERANLERLAVRLGVGSRLRFVGYVVDAPAFLAGLSVAVVPSLSEASGLTAIQAMALGVPVVATSVGGLPEVVLDGVTGLLVPPADPLAIADAISRLLGDPGLSTAMAEEAVRHAEATFSADRMVAEYVSVYRELAG